ncbi:hypothetical protein AMTR_s00067p00032950 [Amborella trichopoda]|uniref:Uncharacterized protein n=1 Tax=Amborella trichopoda TaxID=13333 RepID=U5CZF9_AMBTC|nr:hypothetical protein AMTR_s00067p00032950 [Amborella trichopoda]
MRDKKIVQLDMRSRKTIQEYDQYLGNVNTITFVDNNHRFVISIDDEEFAGSVVQDPCGD